MYYALDTAQKKLPEISSRLRIPCFILIFIIFTPFYHLQVKLNEKIALLEAAESKTEELKAKVNEQQKLIQKLEDDILKVCIYNFF